MQSAYISTAYLGPVQQYCKLFQYPQIYLETAENYVKQTYRNRCTIAAANGRSRSLSRLSNRTR